MSSRWKIGLSIVGVAFVALAAGIAIAAQQISRHARDWAHDALTRQFNSDVELSSFHISVFPSIQAEGEGLILHFEGRRDLPPMIAVKRFSMRASYFGLLRNRHIALIRLEGLELNVPPRDEGNAGGRTDVRKAVMGFGTVHFDDIISENAVLKVLTTKPGKDPLEFDIDHLVLHSAGTAGELAFRATLTIPAPPGEIVSTGKLGPWQTDAPSVTPVSGAYTLDKADLGVFHGIGGMLSSKGEYKGVLEQIEADGTTDTPNFQVTSAGHPMDLKTTFHAIVDGTDGDIVLQPVEVHFWQTTLVAQGSVEGTKGIPGKKITLDVTGNQARIEDLMMFAVKSSPAMTGPIHLKTKFILPQGKQDIPDRVNLDGSFDLTSVHFASDTVQQNLDNFSKRSLGNPRDVKDPNNPDETDDVATAMKGNFRQANGILTLSDLGFQVPGAGVQLSGTYNLEGETLDLHGKLEMQAKLSQTTTGVKSFLLNAVDPLFEKNGHGTELPIKITGSVDHPTYGLDFHHKEAENKSAK